MRIPESFNGRNPQSRRDLASSLRARTHNLTPPPPSRAGRERDAGLRRPPRSRSSGRELRAHPCHDCPDREDHARWAERWFKLDRDARTLRAPHRAAHQHHRPAVRPGLRRAHRAGLPRRRRGHRPRPPAAADLHRDGPGGRRVAADRRSRPASGPSGLAAALSTLVFEARRPDDAVVAAAPRRRAASVLDELVLLWRDLSDALERRAPARLPPRARTSASPGRPTAGPRATTSTRCSPRPTWPRATSCAGSSSCSTSPTRSPTPPVTAPSAHTARDVVRRIRRGVVAVAPLED